LTKKLSRRLFGCVALAVLLTCPHGAAGAAAARVPVPLGALAGLHQAGPANGAVQLHLAFELQPKADLDGLAARPTRCSVGVIPRAPPSTITRSMYPMSTPSSSEVEQTTVRSLPLRSSASVRWRTLRSSAL
jgi:hypothetical protein